MEIWLKDLQENGHLLLSYKEQNTQHILDKENFFLALAFKEQLEMLNALGKDRICIESTHGITGYKFELITILATDEYEEGLPVAVSV